MLLKDKRCADVSIINRINIMGLPGVVVSNPLAVGHVLGHKHGIKDLAKSAVAYQVLDLVGSLERLMPV